MKPGFEGGLCDWKMDVVWRHDDHKIHAAISRQCRFDVHHRLEIWITTLWIEAQRLAGHAAIFRITREGTTNKLDLTIQPCR